MASSKTSGSDYAIRFNASSTRDSSDDEVCNKEENHEEYAPNTFEDPLRASLSKYKVPKDDSAKRMKKKKVDVVRLEMCSDKKNFYEQNARKEFMNIKESEIIKEKPPQTKGPLVKPLSAIRKKHSSSLIAQPQSAPSSELSSPTTLSKRHHLPSSSALNSNSSCKDMCSLDVDKESKFSMTSASDVTLSLNANNCNNKEDVFSIFSGLKDKLGRFSAESREILDRKVFKTTSVDVPKIASVLAGNPIEGELLGEEAKEDTQFDMCLPSKEEKTEVESSRQSSFESATSLEPLETEMKEMLPRSGMDGEAQSSSFDIGRLMKLVHSDSSRKLSPRSSCDEDKKTEDSDSTRMDDSTTSLEMSMTPSDILTHEAAVDAFRASASSLLDPGTKRLTETSSGHLKLVKKSSISGAQKNVNPFTSDKKETISKSSSISMTLSSLLSRQKSSSKFSSGTSPEAIVMSPKNNEAKLEESVGNLNDQTALDQSLVARDISIVTTSEDLTMAEEYLVLHGSRWCLTKYCESFKRRISSVFFPLVMIFVAWMFVPLPPYAAGMIAGVLGTLLTIQAINLFHKVFSKSKKPSKECLFEFESASVASDGTEAMDIRESKNADGSFKGWLNELGSSSANAGKVIYDPRDYHINSTHTVYVTLEGTNLRIQTPRLSMPKRALWSDESPTSVNFVRQRHYDLLGSKVLLLPENLVSKRLWSKKYPICIEVMKTNSTHGTSLRSRTNAAKSSPSTVKGSDTQVEVASQTADSSSNSITSMATSSSQSFDQVKKVLYLFARTSREKEEWFRRFRAASEGKPWPTRFSDVTRNVKAAQAFKRKTHRRAASQPNKKSMVDSDHIPTDNGPPDTHSSDALDPSSHTSSFIDYASLTPEQNLSYYAQYMNRSVLTRRNSRTDPGDLSKAGGALLDGSSKRSSSLGGNSTMEKRGKENLKNEGKKDESVSSDESTPSAGSCDQQLLWLNTLISRCFMDFLREKYWAEKIREKIQKKLSKIHVPYIMDQLSVTGIDLGSSVPTICSASPPYLDDRGFWVDLKVSYSGGFCITMETKCNLMKLKQSPPNKSAEGSLDNSDLSSQLNSQEVNKRIAALDSDEEDSAESSTDEESRMFEQDLDEAGEDKKMNQPIGKRLLRLVDKISQSRYFQQATDYKYIRRAIEEVSNTRLELNVEVKFLEGILAINIPPPPTDRIWYGFRGNPEFDLAARPRVGVREVSLSPVTEWIEKKLAIEFQRVFVMPNMDDVKIPLMLDHLTS